MRALLTVSAVSLALTGCSVERDYVPSSNERADSRSIFGNDDQDANQDASYGVLPITGGRVRGDIGAVTNFDATTDYVDSYTDDYYSSITLTATDPQGRVGMIILDITSMDLRNAPAGTYDYSAQNIDGTEIYVTGCSSSSSDDALYDAPAEEGVIEVTDNEDGTRGIDVEATLPNGTGGTSQAQASFTLE